MTKAISVAFPALGAWALIFGGPEWAAHLFMFGVWFSVALFVTIAALLLHLGPGYGQEVAWSEKWMGMVVVAVLVVAGRPVVAAIYCFALMVAMFLVDEGAPEV